MAKRHTCLVELSRDHYFGLLLAVRLRQGDQALTRLWSHDPLWQARYVVDFFEQELRFHFRAEEEILFPLVGGEIPSSRPIIAGLLDDHRNLESKTMALKEVNQETLREDLAALGTLLESHIRTEERSLFPLIESQASASLLDGIDREMRERYGSRPHTPFRGEEPAT